MTDPEQPPETDVDRLREDVDYLIALLEPSLLTGGQPTPVPPGTTAGASGPQRPTSAHAWHTLTPTEAARAWTTMTDWVDWLTERYQLDDTLPGCWYRHGALVDELDALRAAWVGAYRDPAARPTDAAAWHELLARALTRIRDWDRYGCAAGTHRDHQPLPPTPEARTARDEHVYADIQRRARNQLPSEVG